MSFTESSNRIIIEKDLNLMKQAHYQDRKRAARIREIKHYKGFFNLGGVLVDSNYEASMTDDNGWKMVFGDTITGWYLIINNYTKIDLPSYQKLGVMLIQDTNTGDYYAITEMNEYIIGIVPLVYDRYVIKIPNEFPLALDNYETLGKQIISMIKACNSSGDYWYTKEKANVYIKFNGNARRLTSDDDWYYVSLRPDFDTLHPWKDDYFSWSCDCQTWGWILTPYGDKNIWKPNKYGIELNGQKAPWDNIMSKSGAVIRSMDFRYSDKTGSLNIYDYTLLVECGGPTGVFNDMDIYVYDESGDRYHLWIYKHGIDQHTVSWNSDAGNIKRIDILVND